jgi:carboxymethylenebutenolidase
MNYFQKYLVEEFAEDYQEGHLTRRDALKLIGAVTGSLALASSILAACSPPPETPVSVATSAATITATPTDNSATDTPISEATGAPTDAPTAEASPTSQSVNVSPDDPTIQADEVQFPSQEAMVQAYLARPASARPDPVVLVCHENRGLTDHIRDVARRLAKAGYVALAVDLLSRQGGTAAVGNENVPGVLGNTSPEQFVQDFRSGWEYLKSQTYADTNRLGMVGFCFGGGVTWLVATKMPELKAAVPFYGPHPPLEGVPDIQAAVRAIYAGNDQRINQGIPAIEEAMLQNSKVFEKIIYPNVDHAFHNDTGSRYNAEAARDAWVKTLEWFATYLS